MVSVDGDELLAQWAALSQQQQRFTDLYVQSLGPAGEAARERLGLREVEPGRKYTDELAALRAEAREGRLKAERLGRVPWVTGLGLLALLLVFFTIRAGQTRAGVLGSVSYLVVFNALFFGRGYAYSLSILNTEQQIKAFFYGRMLEVAVLTCLVGLLAGLVGTWRRRYLVVDVLEAVVVAVMWPMILVFLQVLYAVYLHGIDFSWFLPDLGWVSSTTWTSCSWCPWD